MLVCKVSGIHLSSKETIICNSFVVPSITDIELSQVKHSVLAAASLACARQALKLSPVWPERLQKITSYDSQALTSHAAKIWNLYNHTIADEREP